MGKKLFDFCIGNPPYQEETIQNEASKSNGQTPKKNIFHYFQIAADSISECSTVLIYPAGRWIHRSGKGLSKFGLEQINDIHLSKIILFPDSKDIFPTAAIADGVCIVIKNKCKKKAGFMYVYSHNGKSITVNLDNPGEDLIPLNPNNISIITKVEQFVQKEHLKWLYTRILSRSLFGIESDFVEKNPSIVREYKENDQIDFGQEIKLFTNDKAGKAGRAKWYVTNRNVIQTNQSYIDLWKVVVSSANAGGQKRDNQLEIFDNHSAFGRSRVALSAFESKEEATNFFEYCKTYLIKFMFLMTDEALTSLGKRVPDLDNYKNSNTLLNFSADLNEQLYQLVGLTSDEVDYIKHYVDAKRKER